MAATTLDLASLQDGRFRSLTGENRSWFIQVLQDLLDREGGTVLATVPDLTSAYGKPYQYTLQPGARVEGGSWHLAVVGERQGGPSGPTELLKLSNNGPAQYTAGPDDVLVTWLEINVGFVVAHFRFVTAE